MLRPHIIRDCDGGTVLAPQRAQVQHAAIRCPQECVGDGEPAGVAVSRLARPHDAADVVDGVGTAGPSAERSHVDHAGTGGPQERVAAAAYHFGPIVDAQRHARGAERPQIAHAVRRRPYERARLTRLGLGQADHRAAVVQVVGDACGPAEGAEVDHRAGLDDDEGVLHWGDGAAAVPRYLAAPVDGERLALVSPERAEVLNGDRDGDQRRPSAWLAHSPASTAVSDVGPSKRRTRMAARPARSTATRCRIETWPSAGLYRSRSWAPPASPAEPSRMAGPARALKS